MMHRFTAAASPLRLPLLLALLTPLFFTTLPASAKQPQATEKASSGFAGAEFTPGDNNGANFLGITTVPEYERYDSANRWSTVRAADLLVELKKFKGIGGSPAMRNIWRDVLLSDFSGLKASGPAEQTALMAERLRILNRLGFFDEAVRLYQQAAMKRPIPEKIAIEAINAMALSGSADGACLETMMAAKNLKGKNWSQDAALCARYFGQDERAASIYDTIAKDSGSGFRAVYKALGSKGGGVVQADIPALWRTLLLANGATVTSQSLRKADPMVFASLAESVHVPLNMRLVAASRAADAGTVGFDRLRKLYEAKHPTDTGVAAIIKQMEAGEELPQSDLYSAARFTFEGNARARIVDNALKSLRPRTNIKGHVFGWIVDKLTLQPDRIKWFAPHGYALMMATNRAASAKIYYDAGNLQHSPMAIIEALEEGKPWSPKQVEAWKYGMEERFGDHADSRINKSLTLLKAYDTDNKLALAGQNGVKNDVSAASASPRFLKDSIQKGGRGLTLITALNRLGTAPQASQLSTDELAEMARVFAQQGLFGPRKKITLEILLQTVL
jgi:hypothetical protein